MRIALLSNGITYPLAGQSGVSERVHSSAADVKIQPAARTETFYPLGANYSDQEDYGAVTWRISFSTTRLFATAAEAEIFATYYEGTTPRTGTLVIDSIDGAVVTTRHLLNAVVSPPRRQIMGATLRLEYEAIGGEIVPVTPIPLGPAMRWNWTLQQWQTIPNQWQTL